MGLILILKNNMLEKVVSVDLVDVFENGLIQTRTKTAIKEDFRIQGICAALHTADVVTVLVGASPIGF